MDGPSEPSQETPSNKQKGNRNANRGTGGGEDPERRPDHHHRRREAHAQNSQRRGHGAAPLRHEARQDRRARRRRDRQKQNRQRRDVREAIAEEEGRRPARAATRRLDHARGATQPQDRRHRLSPRTHRPGPVHPALRRQGRGPHPSRRATRFQEHGPGRRRRRLHRRTTNGAAGTDDGTDPKRTGNPGAGYARRTGGEAHADAAHRMGLRGSGGHGDGREQPRCPPPRTLMGQAHGRHGMERAGRPRLRGPDHRQGRRPDIARRARHHPARRLRTGRANPGADPRADGRAKPGDAGNGAGKPTGTHTGRNPVEGPATADAAQNQRSQAGRQRAEAEADPVEEGTARTVQDPAHPPRTGTARPARAAERKPQ